MNLRVIPTKAHGVIDLATGPTLVAAPTALRMNGDRAASLSPRLVGTAAMIYSLLTDYELGLKRVLPMRTHLALDVVTGVALAAAPWLSGGARQGTRQWLPHALVGAQALLLALTTETRPPRTSRLRAVRAAVPSRAAMVVGGAAAAAVAFAVARRKRASDDADEPAPNGI
jgi:hypothetical protein